MVRILDVGGGMSASIREPTRGDFPPNLGGAVEYSFTHLVYKVMDIMGEALGAFLAGLGVSFLERVEPSLVEYTAPLIDLLLQADDLPANFRTFLEQLKEPTHEGAAMMLSQVSGQVTNAATGSVLNAIMAPATRWANKTFRPALPDVASLVTMANRGIIDRGKATEMMQYLGYRDDFIEAMFTLSRQEAGAGDWVRGYMRGDVSQGDLQAAMARQNIPNDVVNLFINNAVQYMQQDQVVSGVFRGEYGLSEYFTRMSKLGYEQGEAQSILNVSRPMPGPGDLVRFALREAYRDDVAQRWAYDEERPGQFDVDMLKWGYDETASRYYWRAHWELPSPVQGFEMLHRGLIDRGELYTLLKLNDYPAYWREKLTQIAYHPLTRVDARRMFGLGVLDRAGVKRAYLDLGYNDENAELMTEFTVRYETAEPETKEEKNRELTRSLVVRAYRKGMLDAAETRTKLEALRYTGEDITFMLQMEDFEAEIAASPDLVTDYRDDCRALIERAYGRRVISRDQAERALGDLGIAPEAIEYRLASLDLGYNLDQLDNSLERLGTGYLSGAMTRGETINALDRLNVTGTLQRQVLGEWDEANRYPDRRLSLTAYRDAMILGEISRGDFELAMGQMGYNLRDTEIYVVSQCVSRGAFHLLTRAERRRHNISESMVTGAGSEEEEE